MNKPQNAIIDHQQFNLLRIILVGTIDQGFDLLVIYEQYILNIINAFLSSVHYS
jgi:hypothetical protein